MTPRPLPDREALHARIWREPMPKVAAELGMSSPGLAKLCSRLGVPTPPRGYWSKADRDAAPPPLPPPDPVAPRRRRLEPEARRGQLLDLAASLITREGVHAATLKRLAREAGVSEARVQGLFGGRTGLLADLARRELASVEAAQAASIAQGEGISDRLARSTQSYLRQVEQRGALLQILLGNPQVRQALRAERQAEGQQRRAAVAERFTASAGLPADAALGATVMLTGLCLRAGRLLARKRIGLDRAEALSLAMVRHANRRLARALGGEGVETA